MVRSTFKLLIKVTLAATAFLPRMVEAVPPIRIGVIQSLTGIAAEDGRTVTNALMLAREELQPRYAVELIVEDDATSAKTSVTAFQRIASSGVDAIIGSTYGFVTDSLIPLAARTRTVLINSSSLLEAFDAAHGDGYFFETAIALAEDMKPFEQYLRAHNELRSAVMVHTSSHWGLIQRDAYAARCKSRNVAILEDIELPAQDQNDWGVLVPRFKQKQPMLIIAMLNREDIELLLEKMHQLRLNAPVFASKNTWDALRMSFRNSNYEGTCFPYAVPDSPAYVAFARRYRQKFGDEPRIFADASYDTLFLLAEAVTRARARNVPLKDVLQSDHLSAPFAEYHYSHERSLTNQRAFLMCVENGSIRRHGEAADK